MSLAAEIENHRDIVLRELDSVHDYYVVTKRAWRMVQGSVLRRGRFSVFNVVTGNRTTEQDLPQKAQNYIANYLAVATFQQAVSLLEDFVFGAMRSWMLAYPHRIARKQIPISVVFAAADLDAVKLAAIDREVNDIQYRNVRGWFAEFDEMVKLLMTA